jgi:hypothetical protein
LVPFSSWNNFLEEPRDPRAPHVKFKVGQIFRHKKFRYRAVIIGWDEVAKTPDWWITDIYKNKKVSISQLNLDIRFYFRSGFKSPTTLL